MRKQPVAPTLNGLITEYLEMIPDAGTSVLLDRHPIDIMLIKENMVKTVRIHPALADRRLEAGKT